MTIEEIIRGIIKEELAVYMQGGQAQPQYPAIPVTPTAPPPPVAAPPAPPQPQVTGAPPIGAVPPGPPGPPGPPVTAPLGPPVAQPPVTQSSMPQPMTGVPTLDEIRALANDFSRAKPERAGEFYAFMQSKGVQALADMPPAEYPACKAELQRLMAG